MRFDTRLVHEGQQRQPGTGDIVAPVHVSTTFDRFAQDPPRYFYSRGENPTVEALEACLASLEDARFALAFSSGQAAAAAVLSLLDPGRAIVASDDVYGGTYALFDTSRRRGVRVEQVDLTDLAMVDRALTGEVGLVWIETPTNPLLKITDIAAVSALAHERAAMVVVDNTFASPALQRPLAAGAQVSLYSTTKFVAGHGDVLGGALVLDDPAVFERLAQHRSVVGSVPGALDCFLVHRGVKTLSLRVARQVSNARALVQALVASPVVGAVRYPGLPSHPQHCLATRQMSAPGAIISFEYLGDPWSLLRGTELFAAAVSLGGVRSLIECPAFMTHQPVPRQTRLKLGITDQLIRLSPGIEDPADLVEDLSAALESGARGRTPVRSGTGG